MKELLWIGVVRRLTSQSLQSEGHLSPSRQLLDHIEGQPRTSLSYLSREGCRNKCEPDRKGTAGRRDFEIRSFGARDQLGERLARNGGVEASRSSWTTDEVSLWLPSWRELITVVRRAAEPMVEPVSSKPRGAAARNSRTAEQFLLPPSKIRRGGCRAPPRSGGRCCRLKAWLEKPRCRTAVGRAVAASHRPP